jgi:hypothetical protein
MPSRACNISSPLFESWTSPLCLLGTDMVAYVSRCTGLVYQIFSGIALGSKPPFLGTARLEYWGASLAPESPAAHLHLADQR